MRVAFMRVAAVVVLAVAAMFVLYNVVPKGNDAVDENNPGKLTVEAANAAAGQAGAVMELFREMNPTGGKAHASTANASVASNGGASTGGAGSALDKAADNGAPASSQTGDEAETPPEAEPDIWPSDAYISETTSDVQKAYELMKQYSEQGGVENDKLVQAARDLREAWEPLYVQAHKDYKVLNTRIELAKSTSTDYFAQQSALTDNINDPDLLKRMRQSDLREQEIFDAWVAKADDIAALAYDVMRDMEDVDTYIAKTNLSAHFAALQSATGSLPISLGQLELQLEDFVTATDELNATITGQSAVTTN